MGKEWNIIWDYDGTILPFMPYDSEQFMLDYLNRIRPGRLPFYKKIISRLSIEADKRQLIGHSFKKYFNWIIKGIDKDVLLEVNSRLAAHIPDSHIDLFRHLHGRGFNMSIISCGTKDLCEPVLEHKNVSGLFSSITSNNLTYEKNKISGMKYHVLKGEDKIAHAVKLGCDPEKTIVVGDGYTDIPLLDWCSFPVFLDSTGTRHKKPAGGSKYKFIKSLPELTQLLFDYNLVT